MEFNERKIRIDKFLKDTFSKIIDRGVISSKMIYRELTRYGIDDRYNDVDFSRDVYPSLIEKNNQRNKKYNIRNVGYVDYENFNGNFCVFWNDDVLKDSDPVKLYIAWEPECVDNYVNSIMEFMVKNNISYFLKVSKIVRNDMVTIRISNIEDAYKVIDFINNNLRYGRIGNNPFCMNNGIVNLAIDNYNSYNSRVANLISNYYGYKASRGESNIGYDDFVNYVSHVKYTENPSESVRNNPVFLTEIKNLIYKAITSNDIRKFEDHYYSVFKNSKKKRKYNDIKNQNQEVKRDSRVDNFSVETLILFVKATIEKHGRDFAINGLDNYLNFGDVKGLSRINDKNGVKSRDLLNDIDRGQVVSILMNKYGTGDIYLLATMLVDEIINNNIKESNNNREDELSDLLMVAKDTYQKYGYEQTVMAIMNFLVNGYMNNFTRESLDGRMSRDLLKRVSYNNVKKRLMEMYLMDDIENIARCFMDDYVLGENKSKAK